MGRNAEVRLRYARAGKQFSVYELQADGSFRSNCSQLERWLLHYERRNAWQKAMGEALFEQSC